MNLHRRQDGQVLPLVLIATLIILTVAAANVGLLFVYRDRLSIRDAVDAATKAALNAAYSERVPTYYGEQAHVEFDETGEVVDVWYSTYAGAYESRVRLDLQAADRRARAYFAQNLAGDGMNGFELLDWSLDYEFEPRFLTVRVRRPQTEGRTASWEEGFPRWVKARLSVRVEVPVPFGELVGRRRMAVQIQGRAVKPLRGIVPPSPWIREGSNDNVDAWQ